MMRRRTFERFEGEVRFTPSNTLDKSVIYQVKADILLIVDNPKSTIISTIKIEGGPHVTSEVATSNVSLSPRWKLGMSLRDMVEGVITLHRHATGTTQVTWK